MSLILSNWYLLFISVHTQKKDRELTRFLSPKQQILGLLWIEKYTWKETTFFFGYEKKCAQSDEDKNKKIMAYYNWLWLLFQVFSFSVSIFVLLLLFFRSFPSFTVERGLLIEFWKEINCLVSIVSRIFNLIAPGSMTYTQNWI